MEKDNLYIIIARYLDNSISDEENEELSSWLNEKPENKKRFEMYRKIWNSSAEKDVIGDPDHLYPLTDWENIENYIRNKESRKQAKSFGNETLNRSARRPGKLYSWALKAAVIMIIALGSGYLALQLAPSESSQMSDPVFKEIITKRGERANIQLRDGSKVFLNADSKITIPDSFSSVNRSVEFDGQAYFEIVTDPEHPFVVKTKEINIKVIGTSFDVKSYTDDERSTVAVNEGKVLVSNTESPQHQVTLEKGWVGIYSKNNNELVSGEIENTDLYFGWREGRIIFRNSSIKDFANKIERWYDIDVKVDVAPSLIESIRFTSDLKTKSIRDLMDVFRKSTGIQYKIENDTLILSDMEQDD